MRKGKYISLIGTDGSGKSTLSTEIVSRESSAAMIWCGAESYLMWPIRKAVKMLGHGGADSGTSTVTDEEFEASRVRRRRIVERLRFLENIYIWLVLLDYKVQLIFKRRAIRGVKLVVLDRCIFDVGVNLAVALSWSERKLVSFLRTRLTEFDRIDQLFFIRVPASVSMVRKNDIPNIRYVEIRLTLYDAIASSFGIPIIDGEQPLEISFKKIRETLKFLEGNTNVLYVHANNQDVGGADFCLARMAAELGRREEFSVKTVLRLPTKAQDYHEELGSQLLFMRFVRPQTSQGFIVLIIFPALAVWSFLKFVCLFRRQNPEIVHVNDLYDFIPALAARFCGAKVIFHLRMIKEGRWQKLVYGHLVEVLAHHSFSVSNAVRDHYFKSGTLASGKNKHLVVRDWTSDEILNDTPVLNKASSLSESRLNVVMVGRVEAWKGQLVYLDAISKLTPRTRKLADFFLIGGSVPGEENRKYFEKVIAEAERVGCYYLGERADVPALLREADIAVHCSISPDPFPGVVVEALASGLYCIGSDTGGVPEMIVNGKTGALHSSGNSTELAERIDFAIKNPDVRFTCGGNASKHIRELTDKSMIVDQVSSIYRDLLELG